ncbi:hypothetical protein EAI_02629, partial [Harpegnathos saltator]
IRSYTPEEALGLMIDMKLSKTAYKLMLQGARQRNANIYPSYEKVLAANENCYPPKNCITVTETSAEVTLQAFLDVTCKRILELQSVVVPNTPAEEINLTLISKWGFDGSSGQARY